MVNHLRVWKTRQRERRIRHSRQKLGFITEASGDAPTTTVTSHRRTTAPTKAGEPYRALEDWLDRDPSRKSKRRQRTGTNRQITLTMRLRIQRDCKESRTAPVLTSPGNLHRNLRRDRAHSTLRSPGSGKLPSKYIQRRACL